MTGAAVLRRRERIRRADQPVGDARLAEQMAGGGDDVELHLGPGLLEVPGGDRRRAAIVAALDDDAGNLPELRRAADQLSLLEPALVDHIMIFDTGDGDCEFVAGEFL